MSKQSALNKQLKIFLNYFLGPILFIWLSFSIYQQIKAQENLQDSWMMIRSSFSGSRVLKLLIVFMLVFINYALEAIKWRMIQSSIQKISFWKAFKAVLSGHAVAFNSINRIGDTAGRVLFLDEGNRLKGIALSFVGSMSLIIVHLVFGLLGMIYMRFNILDATHHVEGLSLFWMNGLMSILTIGLLVFILLFFRLSWLIRLLEKIPFVAQYRFVVEHMESLHWQFLTKILFFSAIRYVVFIVQYCLLFQVFDVNLNFFDAAALVMVMFLALTIIPSITLAELGIRGNISIQLFGLLSHNTLGIIATAVGIWIMNLVIPAIIGGIFLLGVRFFNSMIKEQT
ncbi:MAG: flippase-like domain-containing protein [Chitinophagaceae bacterium]|nr:flippase-like domain-containing protein [Chitinophagaceae bacterium]